MKRSITALMAIFGLALTVSISACSDATAPDQGDLTFQVDAQTCTGSGVMTFYIDGKTAGSETVVPGSTKTFRINVGTHLAAASTSTITWSSTTVLIPKNGVYTLVLSCP